MHLLRLFIAAALGLMLWASPARAFVPRPPCAPGPAPAGWVYLYVQPVYQTVTDRVWVPERVDWVSEWVWINGRLEQIYRQIVRPGYFDTTTRQVMISAGYWQLVRTNPAPFPLPRPVVVNPGSVGVEGYRSGPGEDLSAFSPLTEWPREAQ